MLTTASSPPAAAGRDATEFELCEADFERVRKLIYKRAGINLQPGKHAMVYSRLARRLRDTGAPTFAAYLDDLERSGNEDDWQQFINCLTTNLTSFFREEHHFHILTETLLARRGSGTVRLWCNAASTGEEPYSLAMTMSETLGSNTAARLLATDIDTQVLAAAKARVYGADARGLSPERLRAHFLRGKGANTGSIRIKPDVAKLIDFQTFNLMSPRWSFGEAFDIVFCRNVMIYFDNPTQLKLMEQMHSVMKPGGLLFVGHSEHFAESRALFRLRGKTVYERL